MREQGKEIDQSSILAQQRDLYTSSLAAAKTLKQRRRKENNRIIGNSAHSDKVVEMQLPKASSPRSKTQAKSVALATQLPVPDDLKSMQQTIEVQVQPALYVVSDWDEFIEDGW